MFQGIQKTVANGLQKALSAFTSEEQAALAESAWAETTLSGTLPQIRKSFRKRDVSRAFVHSTSLSPDKMKGSSCLIKTLFSRLTTLADTQERDLAYVQAERVCQPEQRMYSPQNREGTSQEGSGRAALHFEERSTWRPPFPWSCLLFSCDVRGLWQEHS